MQYGDTFVIVFGSMAAFVETPATGRWPHDIDVAFGGNVSQSDAEAVARDWARTQSIRLSARLSARLQGALDVYDAARKYIAAHGGMAWFDTASPVAAEWDEMEEAAQSVQHYELLIAQRRYVEEMTILPIESHRVRAREGVVTLSTPKGRRGSAIVLRGDVRVAFTEIESLPGIIRVYHGTPDLCIELALEYLACAGGRMFKIHREFRFLPWDGADEGAYTRDGITAVRNARAHCTPEEWRIIVAGLGDFGPVLEAMSTSDGLSADFRAAHADAACAGGDGVLCLDWHSRTFSYPYGFAADWGFSFDRIASLL